MNLMTIILTVLYVTLSVVLASFVASSHVVGLGITSGVIYVILVMLLGLVSR